MIKQPEQVNSPHAELKLLKQATITPAFQADNNDYDEDEANERKKEESRAGYESPDLQLSDSDSEEEGGQKSALLGQLQELHRKLNIVRMETKQSQTTGRRFYDMRQKLIICSPCKPVRIYPGEANSSWAYVPSTWPFKAAIDFLVGRNHVRWVSWPGCTVEGFDRTVVRRCLESDYNTSPVYLSGEISDLWYNNFCQGLLWPLFHCISASVDSLLDNFQSQFEAYTLANEAFRDAVAEIYEEGDLVLVYDYHLMLLPELLRRRYPKIICGFFLHCPFPSTEFYQMLPVRKLMLEGILGADLVAFNHFDYVQKFLNSCTLVLGLESYPSRIEYCGRFVTISICPVGINPEDFELTPSVKSNINALKESHGVGIRKDRKVIVSIDRMDVCKGIPLKLLAMESLLERHPWWRGRVTMFIIAKDQGRRGDRDLRKTVDALVGRVNGRFGYADYIPCHYMKRRILRREIIALNALADVALVCSIREGINTSAMEFVASQQEGNPGVLVYSEFAGCASSFKGAILVNPYDPDQVADGINVALTMPDMSKKIRHHQLSQYVNHYTASLWARRIVSSLQLAAQNAWAFKGLQKLDMRYIKSFYSRSRYRLIILDYDGTLVPYHGTTDLGEPPPAVIVTLEMLIADPANVIYVISGRKREDLEKWLGSISGLGLMAEYGFWVKPAWQKHRLSNATATASAVHPPDPIPQSLHEGFSNLSMTCSTIPSISPFISEGSGNRWQQQPIDLRHLVKDSGGLEGSTEMEYHPLTHDQEWVCKGENVDLSWKDEVVSILYDFTEQTPGSCLEVKESCITWHFKDADPDFGLTQAKHLYLLFEQMLEMHQVRVVMATISKYIVIHPVAMNKGRAINSILDEDTRGFDIIFGIGDERTDEDMWEVLQGSHCFTCTVGKKTSKAQFYVKNCADVLPMLQALQHVPVQAPRKDTVSSAAMVSNLRRWSSFS